MTLFNIDALFQKEFRLKTVKTWSYESFEEFFKPKVDYVVVYGRPLSGKTTVCNLLSKHLGFKWIDYKVYEELARKKLGTDEEPFEGDVPLDNITEEILNLILTETNSGKRFTYAIDGMNKEDLRQMMILTS